MGNQIRTVVLLTVLTVFIVFIGGLIGGRTGMIIALLLAGGMNFFSYWYSDRIVLRMYRAQPVGPGDAPELYGIVETLAGRAGLPMPRVFIIPEDAPNAFATGRNPEHAVIAVTEGLFRIMDHRQIEGVLAHELAHVKNRDILIGSIAATLAGAVMVLASMARWSAIFGGGDDDEGGMGIVGLLIMSIIAPIGAMLVQMAISRSREYLADETGARFAGNPEGLANALETLGQAASRPRLWRSEPNPATAHIFIVNPLSGRRLASLFSTHPPLDERIARLRGQTPPSDHGSPRRAPDRRREAEAFWDRLSDGR